MKDLRSISNEDLINSMRQRLTAEKSSVKKCNKLFDRKVNTYICSKNRQLIFCFTYIGKMGDFYI